MKLKPLYDRVIVSREAAMEKTAGGLFVPDKAKEKPIEATVLAVGCGRLLDTGEVVPLQVKVGDKVLLQKYVGQELKLDGEEVLIVREEELLGILGK